MTHRIPLLALAAVVPLSLTACGGRLGGHNKLVAHDGRS